MYKTIFEIKPIYFTITMIPALFLFLFLCCSVFLLIRAGRGNRKNIVPFVIVAFILCPIFSYSSYTTIKNHNFLYYIYSTGQLVTKTVTGEVSQFHPEPSSGHDSEYFVLDNVYFEYRAQFETGGYNKIAADGGCITQNG